jgi:hypothetical protein
MSTEPLASPARADRDLLPAHALTTNSAAAAYAAAASKPAAGDPATFLTTILAELRDYATVYGLDFEACAEATARRSARNRRSVGTTPTDAPSAERVIRTPKPDTDARRRHAVLPTDLRAVLRSKTQPLAERGITEAIVHYEETPDQEVSIQYALGYDRAGTEHELTTEIDTVLDYAIQRLVPAMPDSGPDNYDGSRGWITLDLEKLTATIQHCWYVVRANDTPAFIASIAEKPIIPQDLH